MKDVVSKYWKPFGAIFFWGVSFVATKDLLAIADPLIIIFLRFLLGALFLGSIAIAKDYNLRLTKTQLKGTIVLALSALIHLFIQLSGMRYTSASNTGWIIATSPAFMSIVGLLVFKEKMTLLNTIGMFIAFMGVLFLIGDGDLRKIDLIENKGDFLVLISAFTWAIYSAINKQIGLKISQTVALFYVFLFISLIITPFILSKNSFSTILAFNWRHWLLIFFLGFFTSGLAYILWAKALQELPSGSVGSFIYIEPFITVITSAIFLGETVTINSIFSGLIIIVGVILSNSQR